MTSVWVVGGEHKPQHWLRPEWTAFHRAVVVRVGPDGAERVLEYRSPREHRPDRDASHVFKAATVVGDTAWLCTQTEVLVCDFPSFAIRRVLSLPCFNDLHHVTPGPEGTLFVAVTGLDAVAELTPEGELIRLVSVVGRSPWDRFSPDVDYRKVPTTKPHRAHPNFVFFLDGKPWVTRLEQRDAVPLDGGAAPLTIHDEPIHDGLVHGDALWFTGVDGALIRFRLGSLDCERFDLNAFTVCGDQPLGWCRGVLPNSTTAWVGFSRIRYTALRRNLSWVRHGFQTSRDHLHRPTRIVLYDLLAGRELREVDLEDVGMTAVFSIHDRSVAQVVR